MAAAARLPCGALSLLRWDAAVMMPRGSADVRGEQLAALETEYHALLTTPKITRLLDRAQANSQGLEDWQLANLREMRRQRDHAIATPVSLISRLARATSRAEVHLGRGARQNNFDLFAPHLEEVVHLVRDKAALLGQALGCRPTTRWWTSSRPVSRRRHRHDLQGAVAAAAGSLIARSDAAGAAARRCRLTGKFTPGKQRTLVVEVMRAIGFPFDRGRLDESEHPFTEGVPGDIRVTTRFDSADPFSGLLGALHETGHAMYDLGLPQAWRDQPVGRDRGMALEESQSLLLEMIVGAAAPSSVSAAVAGEAFRVSGPEWEPENLYRR
jgi:carboxypeptidase Taq